MIKKLKKMKYYVVKYSGPFGFIKPWTAVRDELTYSQTFLSPPTIKGISQKLFGLGEIDCIKRYRLRFGLISDQQEQTWAPLRKISKSRKTGVRSLNNGILKRGVLLNPELFMAFSKRLKKFQKKILIVCMFLNYNLRMIPVIYQSDAIVMRKEHQ